MDCDGVNAGDWNVVEYSVYSSTLPNHLIIHPSMHTSAQGASVRRSQPRPADAPHSTSPWRAEETAETHDSHAGRVTETSGGPGISETGSWTEIERTCQKG
jgi:hypothetical protein